MDLPRAFTGLAERVFCDNLDAESGIRTDGTVIGAGRFDVFGGRLDRTAPSPGFVGVRLTPTIS
jgi:hypothetical protein